MQNGMVRKKRRTKQEFMEGIYRLRELSTLSAVNHHGGALSLCFRLFTHTHHYHR
jgi:hypothetical protein